jgi:hypothetical protein
VKTDNRSTASLTVPMKMLALAVLAAGCATTNAPTVATNQRLAKLQDETAEISRREQQCFNLAVNRSHDEVASTAGSIGAARRQQAGADQESEVSKCKTTADREKEELSARERAEYSIAAQQDHDRAALMSILSTSLTR